MPQELLWIRRHPVPSARRKDICVCLAITGDIWQSGTVMPRRAVPSLSPDIFVISAGIRMPSFPPASSHTDRIPCVSCLPSCGLILSVPARWNRYAAVMASQFPHSIDLCSCSGSRKRCGWVYWRMQRSMA